MPQLAVAVQQFHLSLCRQQHQQLHPLARQQLQVGQLVKEALQQAQLAFLYQVQMQQQQTPSPWGASQPQ
jgi:hypothetical protein